MMDYDSRKEETFKEIKENFKLLKSTILEAFKQLFNRQKNKKT